MSSRKHLLLKIAIGIGIFIVAVVIAAFFIVRSAAFHRYVLAQIVQRADKATGAKVQIGDFTFHWAGLRLDFYRIVIHGSEPASERPLLSIDHASVAIKVVSLLERKFELADVVVDHPVVNLQIGADGRSNLPRPPPAKNHSSSTVTSIFNLAIQHFALNHGEIKYNDLKIPLQAELHQLYVAATFNKALAEYNGSLAYGGGVIQFGSFRPLESSLDVRFSATPTELQVSSLVLNAGANRVAIKASLKNYTNPLIQGTYEASPSTSELARWMKLSAKPAGKATASGSFSYDYAAGRSLLDSLEVNGSAASRKLFIRLASAGSELENVKVQYRLSGGNLEVRDFEARLFGGRVEANLTVHHLSKHPEYSLSASAHSISIARSQDSLKDKRLAAITVEGRLNGKATASWRDSFADLRVRSDAVISAPAKALASSRTQVEIPVDGVLHLAYSRHVLTLANTVLRTPHAEADLNGSVGRGGSALMIIARSDDLHETDLLIASVRRRLAAPRAVKISPFGLSGAAAFHGELSGSISRPDLAGRISGTNLDFRGAAVRRAEAAVNLSPSEIVLRQGSIDAGRGRIQFAASVALRNWSYQPSNAMTLELTANLTPLAEILSIANAHLPVKGLLSAHISLHGSQLQPVGSGSIEITKASAWNQPVQRILARFHGTGSSIEASLTAEAAGGAAAATLTYQPKSQAYDAQLTIKGVRLRQLQAMKRRNLPVSGVLSASAQGRGTLKSPRLAASLNVPQLKIGLQSISDIAAQATVANGVATLSLTSTLSGSQIRGSGTVQLSGGYNTDLTLSTGVIQIGPLLAAWLPGENTGMHGETQLRGWLRGPLKDANRIEAHLEIPSLHVAYQSLQISSAAPITADYHDGSLVVAPAELKGDGTDLRFQATAPLSGSAPLAGAVSGTVDLRVLQLLYPQWESSGKIQLSVKLAGTIKHPEMQGEMQVEDAVVEPPNTPIGVEKMNAVIQFNSTRADIKSLTAEAGGGSVTARGFIVFQHGMHFNLGLAAHRVRIRYPQGVREVVDADLSMTGSRQSALVNGQVLIDRLSLTQQFDLLSFASQFGASSLPAPNGSFTQNVKLNVAVRSSQELALASSQLSLRGSADLRVRGTLADPVVLGRATLTHGQLFFNGRRYQIESGVIQFVNPVSTEPILNVRVTTTVNQYALTVNFIGPFDRLRTTYTSDPPLPALDILNLLLTGQPAEAPGTGLGAQSLLAQGVAGQVSSRVQKLVGISSLTIDPQVGGHGTNPGARIAVQQQVTRRLFFTFSVDVTTSQDDIVQVEYQLSRRLSLQAVRDQNGGYSLEVKVHKTF